jgi:brefeldin A-inhibited guanine nucleotide-exchange protein
LFAERVASYAFDLVTRINQDHFARVIRFGAFADLTVCITDFCKVSKYQKISLQAMEMLRGVVPVMLACPDCPLNEPIPGSPAPSTEVPLVNDPMVKFWFPVLFSFYDIIMNGEDLEVRRL